MFQSIPVFEEKIFAYKVNGKLTTEDCQDFFSKLTILIHKHGPISLLLELEDVQEFEAKATWADYRLDTTHDQSFKKIGITGDKCWEQWMIILANTVTKTEMRYFERDNASAAWDWLRETDEQQAAAKEDLGSIKPYEHILTATDFSPHSEKAIRRAKEIAKEYGASLSIIHVLEPFSHYESGYIMLSSHDPYNDTEEALFQKAEEHLDELKEKLGLSDINSEVLWGIPKTTILSYAEAQKIDLIVMGAHGRRGLSRLIGSTTNSVINRSCCEVLSVHIE